MFQLYDKTRRRLCIAAFLTLGLLPTALVAAWCLERHSHRHVQAVVQTLRRQLGLEVRLDAVRYPRPGVVCYAGLECVDPETRLVVLRCRQLEIAAGVNVPESPRPLFKVTAAQTVLDVAGLDRLRQLWRRLIEGQIGAAADVRLTVSDVTFAQTAAASAAQTFVDIEGSLDALPTGTNVQVQFRLAGSQAAKPMYVQVVRNRQISPPANGVELNTGDDALPGNVLAMLWPEFAVLGPQCGFRGALAAHETAVGWDGQVAGLLTDLNLDRLVTDYFPHRLSGFANLGIRSLCFRQGRIENAVLQLMAGPGTIDRSLIDAAVERCGLTATTELQGARPQVPYSQLGMLLTLDAQGMQLHGCCTDCEPGTILASPRGRMLGEPRKQPQSIAALVQMLVPQSELLVPASQPTERLLRYMPMLQVVAPVGNDRTAPHVTARVPDR